MRSLKLRFILKHLIYLMQDWSFRYERKWQKLYRWTLRGTRDMLKTVGNVWNATQVIPKTTSWGVGATRILELEKILIQIKIWWTTSVLWSRWGRRQKCYDLSQHWSTGLPWHILKWCPCWHTVVYCSLFVSNDGVWWIYIKVKIFSQSTVLYFLEMADFDRSFALFQIWK